MSVAARKAWRRLRRVWRVAFIAVAIQVVVAAFVLGHSSRSWEVDPRQEWLVRAFIPAALLVLAWTLRRFAPHPRPPSFVVAVRRRTVLSALAWIIAASIAGIGVWAASAGASPAFTYPPALVAALALALTRPFRREFHQDLATLRNQKEMESE